MDDIASCQLSQELLEVNVVIFSRISPSLLSEEAIQAKKKTVEKKSTGCFVATPPKTNMVHLKMGAPWKRRFLLETIISRFHVNFWGCISLSSLVLCLCRFGRGPKKRVDAQRTGHVGSSQLEALQATVLLRGTPRIPKPPGPKPPIYY